MPIDVTPEEMLIETRDVQPSKALSPIDAVPAGTSTCPLASGVIQHPASTDDAVRARVTARSSRLIGHGERTDQLIPAQSAR